MLTSPKKHHYIITAGDSRATRTLVFSECSISLSDMSGISGILFKDCTFTPVQHGLSPGFTAVICTELPQTPDLSWFTGSIYMESVGDMVLGANRLSEAIVACLPQGNCLVQEDAESKKMNLYQDRKIRAMTKP